MSWYQDSLAGNSQWGRLKTTDMIILKFFGWVSEHAHILKSKISLYSLGIWSNVRKYPFTQMTAS